ncbi:charged multivesicular body protein 3-like isoform X1 [Paramacrobiotus metropolitanus]|uniref:charged multivesicular body protein 3-like isoform X1 n=1 Tax=Paramacrobiotus metropolitanus TaxID=2943436 RepID=UPI002445C586|nr:charged multivesicular body protein 3-like isoform X1 [Paramacrobiotus metropolitanus]
MGLFGKTTVDPKEQVDAWTKTLRQSARDMDRQIRNIQREEERAKRSLKDAAKKGDKDVCRILAKEIVRSRNTTNKIHLSKVQINSLVLQMRHQLSTLKVSGSLAKSTEVMQAMQSLVKMPEFNRIMQDMAREMTKNSKNGAAVWRELNRMLNRSKPNVVVDFEPNELNKHFAQMGEHGSPHPPAAVPAASESPLFAFEQAGIIEEMMEDAMDVLDEDDIETAADAEVEKVLWELTEGKLGEAPRAVDDSLPAASVAAGSRVPASGSRAPPLKSDHVRAVDNDEEEDVESMRRRLEDLKS